MEESPDPPFETRYKKLLDSAEATNLENRQLPVVEEWELPLIDLSELNHPDKAPSCRKLMSRASQEWGFFQVINHGISNDILESMRAEQVNLMKKTFREKTNYQELNPTGCYQWGTPSPTCLDQISWSESFHVPLNHILVSAGAHTLRSTMEKFAAAVRELAQTLAAILTEEVGHKTISFEETCLPGSCYIRLNRYPPCPVYPYMFGIIPHTDSDFLTVLHPDSAVSGLQLVKEGKWIAVKPNPNALVINIGDLFQAWSNDVYRSVEHRVVTNAERERFSTAYFLCPSYETVIESDVYRSFSFGEYRKRVRDDVKVYGRKIGLPGFLL